MTDFGYTSIGGNEETSTLNVGNVSKFTMGAVPLLLATISIYANGTVAPGNMKCLIYADTGANAPGTLVAKTASFNVSGANAWRTNNLLVPLVAQANTIYWLGYVVDASGPGIRYDITGSRAVKSVGYSFATPNDPFGTPDSSGTAQYSIYASGDPISSVALNRSRRRR